MKTWKMALAAAAATLAMVATTAAYADDAPSVTFNIGAASDYVFRGVSQPDSNPQVFGGADLTAGMFYAGVWASNVDFGDATYAELNASGSPADKWTVSGALGYQSFGDVGGLDYATWNLGVTYALTD